MITDYDSLKAAIKGEFARPNLDETRLEEAIRAVEIDLDTEDDYLQAFSEFRATSAMIAGQDTLGEPTGIRTVRELRITKPNFYLEFKPPQFLDAVRASSAQQQPLYYTQIGSEFRFVPTPDSDYPVEFTGYGDIVPLSDAAPVNQTITANSQLYFWGSIADLLTYVGGTQAQRLQSAPARYTRMLEKAIQSAKRRRVPRGPLRAQVGGTIV